MLSPRAAAAFLMHRLSMKALFPSLYPSNHCSLWVICAYAPTEDYPESQKDQFYNELQNAVDGVPAKHTLVIAGDF
jgi:hypothetical protein